MKRLSLRMLAGASILLVLATMEPQFAIAMDTTPPDITDVTVTDIKEDSATVTWTTDEDSDAFVNYGLQPDYGIVRDATFDKTTHTIQLTGLEPGRKYHFRVVSSDQEGNQGISADYQLETKGESSDSSGSGQSSSDSQGQGQSSSSDSSTSVTTESTKTQQIIQEIQKITSQDQLEKILNEVVKAIQGVSQDLTIVGPPTVIPETTTAKVKWTTDRPASSEVQFSPSSQYVEGENYAYSQQSTGDPTTDHEVELIGLEPYTEYHFQVRSSDAYDITGKSLDYTFMTKASLPSIKNLRILKVEENSATLAWDTTVPAKALIEYQDLSTGAQNSIGRPTLATSNQMRIPDLTLGTRYVAFVISENAGGDRVKSNPITFVTVRDREPPLISNVTNESTLYPGDEAQIQTIVSWDTDEPSLCTMQYREGVAPGVEPTTIDSQDKNYTQRHVQVIVDFASGTVYKFWLNCADQAGNAVRSEDFVLFTPVKEKSIIDIIIENFQGAFGWVKNIGGKGG